MIGRGGFLLFCQGFPEHPYFHLASLFFCRYMLFSAIIMSVSMDSDLLLHLFVHKSDDPRCLGKYRQ